MEFETSFCQDEGPGVTLGGTLGKTVVFLANIVVNSFLNRSIRRH